ncbi:adhesion G-protein coupled receptor G5 isoform X1 [Alosa pseudoharengus]|uniref:adhesion G-protein coupled receptor G5 isoform X1 n=1 Tax=Alosa pseudoharengus TaxID=34774 RepID=UPI003F8981CD
MERLHLIFLSTLTLHVVGTTAKGDMSHCSRQRMPCEKVTECCWGQRSFAACYTQHVRTCRKSRITLDSGPFKQEPVNSSLEGRMDTYYGHRVRVPSEAVNRSRVDASNEVIMTTSVINSSYFTTSRNILEQRVLGVWVGEQEVSNLSQPITITFRRTNCSIQGQCVFWDDNQGNWSQAGCKTSHTDEEFNCSCNHLSFFAILITDGADISHAHQQRLSYIQYCGSALTITLTTLTCLMHLTHRKRKLGHCSTIHLQLSLALLLLHVSFLLSAWGAWHTQGQPITELCQALGAGLHWALLATFSWTAIEGFHLYLLLVRIFNIYVRRYLLKLGLLGWGLPSVTVILCAALRMYGPYNHKTDSSSNNRSFECGRDNKSAISVNQSQPPSDGPTLCWLSGSGVGGQVSVSVVRYGTVHAYLGAVLLFNTVILLLIGCKLFGAGPQAVQRRGRVCHDAMTLLGLSCALGLPWGLALCSHGPLTLTTTYLFTILNGLQGVFLFLWALAMTCRRHHASSSQSTMKMSSLGAS